MANTMKMKIMQTQHDFKPSFSLESELVDVDTALSLFTEEQEVPVVIVDKRITANDIRAKILRMQKHSLMF